MNINIFNNVLHEKILCRLVVAIFLFLSMSAFSIKANALVHETCSATPTIIDDVKLLNSGDATELNYLMNLFAADSGCTIYKKFDNWDGTFPLSSEDGNITISYADSYMFNWKSTYKVCAVLVKGGQANKVYTYDLANCSCSGNELVAPNNNGGGNPTKAISHVSFLYSNQPCETQEKCYSSDTAWVAGSKYTSKGNWATYVTYGGVTQTIPIYAGQTKLAGSATLSPAGTGSVTIDISLINGFVFYYPSTIVDDNLKLQGYSVKPSGNPAPGLFANKLSVPLGQTSASITVPLDKYYGIHLDVAQEIACSVPAQ